MATITGDSLANTLIGTIDDDLILALEGNDTVSGGAGNDSIDGGDGNDSISGDAGDDTLIGGEGHDTLDGGLDDDTVMFAGDRADYTVTQVDSTTVSLDDGNGNVTLVTNVESFAFADDVFNFDDVHVPPVSDDDLFIGTATDGEVFSGGVGDDTLTGLIRTDMFDGGDGFDFIDFSQETGGIQIALETFPWDPNDPIELTVRTYDANSFGGFGGFGSTPPPGTFTGVEKVKGTSYDDVIGTHMSDVVYIDGGDGNDQIVSGLGDETLVGGAGDDSLSGRLGDDEITTGTGFDTVSVSRRPYSTPTGDGHDVITDFDAATDTLLFLYSYQVDSDFDPLSTASQTAEGTLFSYTDDSSILLSGVDLDDLSSANILTHDPYAYLAPAW